MCMKIIILDIILHHVLFIFVNGQIMNNLDFVELTLNFCLFQGCFITFIFLIALNWIQCHTQQLRS